MTNHVWLGNNRYQVTDSFDRSSDSDDMKALRALDNFLTTRLADPDVRAELEQKHTESHDRRCCREHGTHTTPHRGCVR